MKWWLLVLLIAVLIAAFPGDAHDPGPRVSETIAEPRPIVTRTPRPPDPCLEPLRNAISNFLATGSMGEQAIAISKTCKNEHIFIEVRWGIETNDRKVLIEALKNVSR